MTKPSHTTCDGNQAICKRCEHNFGYHRTPGTECAYYCPEWDMYCQCPCFFNLSAERALIDPQPTDKPGEL